MESLEAALLFWSEIWTFFIDWFIDTVPILFGIF